MTDMTEEEADALDEYFTKHLPKVDPAKGGVTTRHGSHVAAFDRLPGDLCPKGSGCIYDG